MKYRKAQIDGFCECGNCGKRISGIQWYNTNHDEFVCETCKQKNK